MPAGPLDSLAHQCFEPFVHELSAWLFGGTANGWLETVDLEEGYDLQQIRASFQSSGEGEATLVPKSTANVVNNCLSAQEDLTSARYAIVGAVVLSVGAVLATPVVTVSAVTGAVVYTAARVFLGKAAAGLVGIGLAGELAHTKKKQLNRCRRDNQLV